MSGSDPIRTELTLGAPLADDVQDRARRAVAGRARDAADCAQLLAMLGLDSAAETQPGHCRQCGAEMPMFASTQTALYSGMCRPCRKAVSV